MQVTNLSILAEMLLESPDKGTPQRSLGDSNGAPKMFLQSDLSQLV